MPILIPEPEQRQAAWENLSYERRALVSVQDYLRLFADMPPLHQTLKEDSEPWPDGSGRSYEWLWQAGDYLWQVSARDATEASDFLLLGKVSISIGGNTAELEKLRNADVQVLYQPPPWW